MAIEVMDGKFKVENSCSISADDTLLLQIKVSGDIFAFPEIELAIYSENNLPFNSLGHLMITRIFKDQFLWSDNLILKVVCEPASKSHFTDASFYSGGSLSSDIFLNFQSTLDIWNKNKTS